MIQTYESIFDDSGSVIRGRTKLFISDVREDGEILHLEYGTLCVPNGSGTMFIVDDWLIDQLDKVQFKDGTLSVKDGMELEPPVKSEKQLQIEAIERQLAALKAEPDEPTSTEEETDTPLLDYTEAPSE